MNKGKRVALVPPPDMQVQAQKGWAWLQSGGDLSSIAASLNNHMVRRVPPPQQVQRLRGAVKAFSFHWSNAQAQWDVIAIREFPWGIDGAEFILFVGKNALSPVGKPWSLAEMRYVAKGLNNHPGFASSPESAQRVAYRYIKRVVAALTG